MVTVEAGRVRSDEGKHHAALSKAKALAKALTLRLSAGRAIYRQLVPPLPSLQKHRLIAPASRKLEEEACEQTFVVAVVVHDSINQINSTPVLLEPLWARSTHVMTFRAITLDWLDHGVLLRLTTPPPPDAKTWAILGCECV